MIDNFEEYNKLFNEINKSLKESINIHIIGGAALLFRGIKPSTKDIDIIVSSEQEFQSLIKSLKELNFKDTGFGIGYDNFKLEKRIKKDDIEIDIFLKEVCSKFSLSKGMTERSELIIKLDNLNVYLCSNEDIFAFKTMTSRDQDLEDCIELAKRGLNWDMILEEIKYQIKNSGNNIWITWINERLIELEKMGLEIPIIDETDKLSIKYLDKK